MALENDAQAIYIDIKTGVENRRKGSFFFTYHSRLLIFTYEQHSPFPYPVKACIISYSLTRVHSLNMEN